MLSIARVVYKRENRKSQRGFVASVSNLIDLVYVCDKG